MLRQEAGELVHGLPAAKRREAVAIAVAGVVVAGFGIPEVLAEIRSQLAGGLDTAQRFADVTDGRHAPGDSLWSKDRYLVDCLDLPRTVLVRVQPPIRRDAFATRCRDVARAAVAQMPTYSAAWLVIAEASAALDDLRGLSDGLLRSAETAPDLAWLAARRSALAAEHLTQLAGPALAAYRADLATLLRSRTGTDALAARYVREREQRETITALVEVTPAATQRRFLDRVRMLAEPRP